MKKLTPILILVFLLAACDQSTDQHPALDLKQLQGQWVVINYWAKWCKPCIKEIPELNELDHKYPQVTVLGVNYDGETGAELAEQVEQLGIEFALLDADPAGEIGIPRPMVLPTTVILDPSGALKQTLVGPQTLEALAQATEQLPTTNSP